MSNEIQMLAIQLYNESSEEYGRLIRLLIGLSAGAVTILSGIFNEHGYLSWLVIGSLILHLVSLCLGLSMQYWLMKRPKDELEKMVSLLEKGDGVQFVHTKTKTLSLLLQERTPIRLLLSQIATFLVALCLLFVYLTVNISI